MPDGPNALGILARHIPAKLVAWATMAVMLSFVALVLVFLIAVALGFQVKFFDMNFGRAPDWEQTPEPAFPGGVVVASTVQCARLDGDGWVPFEAGQGRMIVGVGSTTDARGEARGYAGSGETGGAFQTVLDVAQMPEHRHGIKDQKTSSDGSHTHDYANGKTDGNGGAEQGGARPERTLATDPAGDHAHVLNGVVEAAGGGAPHNNLPPYIALYLCTQDTG